MPNGNTAAGVIQHLERAVAEAAPGDRLPSVRELMARHRAGPATIQRAVGALVARGVVEARPGKGTFVAERAAAPGESVAPDLAWQAVALGASPYTDAGPLEDLRRPPPTGDILLSTGYLPAELQPIGALAQALARAARRPDAWGRVALEGVAALREHFAAEVGGGAEAADVLVCPGGQSALNACLRALAQPGAPVVVESPTYSGFLVLARAAGLKPVPVPSDAGGVRPDLLADALERTGARVAYLQPAFANPHGTTLATQRRAEVLAAAAAAGAFVIEDDPFRELSLDARAGPPPPLWHDDRDGHVVTVRSLTKSASPGLRVAAVLARGPAATRIRAARIVDDLLVAGPLQEAAVALVSSPAWARHLRALRATLRERRDALAAAVDRELGPGRIAALPRGGFHLWVALDPHEDDAETAARAARAGVVVSAGRSFFPAEPTGPHLRLSFAGAPPDRLAEGVARLARARR